jgi:hypothetical protein
MFSVILVSRNDNYECHLGIENEIIKRTMMTYDSLMSVSEVDFEFVLVDYGSYPTRLSDHIKESNIKHCYIQPTGIDFLNGLFGEHQNDFYEYIAKDIGIHVSDHDLVLITNIDLIFMDKITDKCIESVRNNSVLTAKKSDIPYDFVTKTADVIANEYAQGNVPILTTHPCTHAGDYTFVSKENYFEVGGFEYVPRNVHVDSKLIEDLFQIGVDVECDHCHILHLDHKLGGNSKINESRGLGQQVTIDISIDEFVSKYVDVYS